VQNGPIRTLAPSSAPRSTIAVGWMMAPVGCGTTKVGIAFIRLTFRLHHHNKSALPYDPERLQPTQSLLPHISEFASNALYRRKMQQQCGSLIPAAPVP
jgi:hypothetical protein